VTQKGLKLQTQMSLMFGTCSLLS